MHVNCDDGFHWSARKLVFYGRNSEIFSLDSLDYLAWKTQFIEGNMLVNVWNILPDMIKNSAFSKVCGNSNLK